MNEATENRWSEEEWTILQQSTPDEESLLRVLELFEHKHVQMKDDLSTTENRYKAIIDAQDDLVCRYHPHTCSLTFVNEAYAKFHNATIDGLLGQSIFSLIPLENREQARAVVADMLCNPRPLISVFPSMNDGEQRWYQWHDTPIFDSHNRIVEVQTVGRDITAFKKLEQEQVRRQVEQTQRRIITDFIRDASHEFRTPLTIMRSSIYIARKSENLDNIRARLDKIEAQASQLTELVDALVLMARLDSDVHQHRLWTNDIQFALRGVLENYTSNSALKRHIAIKWVKLPDITANHADLALAFKEIIQNAIAHTQEGDTITIELQALEDAVEVVIHDDGNGIPPEVLPYIWERFYRGDKARTTRGFGLGLPIVRRIVEMHGGSIQIESQLGEGTRVTLRLPIHLPEPTDDTLTHAR